MGGFLEKFVNNPIGTVSDTVSGFVSNPAGAINDYWNSGGRDAATLAALAAAAYATGGASLGAEGAAGAGAAGAAGAGAAGAAGGSSWMTPAAIFGSSLLGAGASRSAASQQSDASRYAAELSNQQYIIEKP